MERGNLWAFGVEIKLQRCYCARSMHGAPPAGLSKRLEYAFKYLVGWFFAWLAFSARRSARVRKLLSESKRVVLMRLDERVGEALLTTPLIEELASRGYDVTVVVHPKCARVLEGHPKAKVIPFDRSSWWMLPLAPGVRALQTVTEGAVVVNCSSWSEYSGTPALISRFASPNGCVVGPQLGPAGELCDEAVRPRDDTTSELQQRLHYLSVLGFEPGPPKLSFRTPRESEQIRAFIAALKKPYVVVNPGGRLGWRRVPAEVFKAVCLELARLGRTPVVTFGPGEEPLARQVAPEGAVLAPPTDLDELAAVMAKAELTVCNNTGPMHLSVAVGTKTLGLFLHMPIERWGHGPPHVMVDLTPHEGSPEQMARSIPLVAALGAKAI
jgi:ADP-heptose:LPS heptosyltransferase